MDNMEATGNLRAIKMHLSMGVKVHVKDGKSRR